MLPKIERALILRVQRAHAGKTLPFDKLYFFHTDAESSIAQVFPYSLVLTLTAGFTEMIRNVVQFCRAEHKAYPLRRRNEVALNAQFSVDSFNEILENQSKYWAVVPMLYLSRRSQDGKPRVESKDCVPEYICAKPERQYRQSQTHVRWHYRQKVVDEALTEFHHKKRMKRLFSERSYLLIAGEAYRPICVACSAHIEALNGQCFFGSPACYERLSTTTPATFTTGMAAYREFLKALAETTEPEMGKLE